MKIFVGIGSVVFVLSLSFVLKVDAKKRSKNVRWDFNETLVVHLWVVGHFT